MPLGAVLALSWCGEVSLRGKRIIIGLVPLELEVRLLWCGGGVVLNGSYRGKLIIIL